MAERISWEIHQTTNKIGMAYAKISVIISEI